MAEACIRYDPVQSGKSNYRHGNHSRCSILASLITLITSPIVIIKVAIKKVYEDGPQEIMMAIEFKRIKNGYEQYIKDIGGIQ